MPVSSHSRRRCDWVAGFSLIAVRAALAKNTTPVYRPETYNGCVALVSQNVSLVTGAGGFVGSALSKSLAEQGWQVRTNSLRLLSEPSKWQLAMGSVRCVVHLAAHVHRMGAEASDEQAFEEINVEGSRFVAQQALRAGVERFVFLSSAKVNGEGSERPYGPSDEPKPSDAYGRSKWAAERAVREVCEAGRMQCVIVRPPLVYGPGVKANFRRLMQWVDLGVPLPLRSIRNERSLIGLSNLVSFLKTCMEHPNAPAETWLIADDEPVSTPRLLQAIAHHMNRPSRLFSFPPSLLRFLAGPLRVRNEMSRLCDSLLVDASRARGELGWRPLRSFDDELARTVSAYLAERNQ